MVVGVSDGSLVSDVSSIVVVVVASVVSAGTEDSVGSDGAEEVVGSEGVEGVVGSEGVDGFDDSEVEGSDGFAGTTGAGFVYSSLKPKLVAALAFVLTDAADCVFSFVS